MESLHKSIQKKRHMLPRHGACLTCRKSKQRCDGTRPECLECVSVNRKCRYEDSTYQTRTQQLQARIKELEAQIQSIKSTRSKVDSRSTPQSPSVAPGLHQHPDETSSNSSYISPASTASLGDSLFSNPGSLSPSTTSYGNELDLSDSIQLELPQASVDSLLDIFSLRYYQCGFELHLGRVMQCMHPSATEPITPALLDSILLMACHFAEDPKLKLWESILLARTRLNIENNISRALEASHENYNSLHHAQAMLMLGIYYYFKGRLLEGHVHVTHAARFAVALGLNRLNSRIFRPNTETSKAKSSSRIGQWRPRDAVQLGEAINLWWTCSSWDLGGSTINGLPIAVPLDEVTTVWPRSLSDFEFGYELPDDDYSAASILDPELIFTVADTSGDSFPALLAKANILMQCASRLDTERATSSRCTEEWWSMFERCDQSLNRFMQTMPPIHLAQSAQELAHYVLIHTAIYCGQVQLHAVPAEVEFTLGAQGDPNYILPEGALGGISYSICSNACRAASLASSLLLDVDPSHTHMFSGIAWVCVYEVSVRDAPKLRRVGRIDEAVDKETQGDTMLQCMRGLVATFPVMELHIEQMREKKRINLMLSVD